MTTAPHILLHRVKPNRLTRLASRLGLIVYRSPGPRDQAVTVTISQTKLAELGNPPWILVVGVPPNEETTG